MMAAQSLNPFLDGTSGRNTRGLLRIIILCTIAGAAVASRLFSVIRKSGLELVVLTSARYSYCKMLTMNRTRF